MSEQLISRPEKTEYPPYFEGYVSLVPDGDVREILRGQVEDTLTLLRGVGATRGDHRYEPGKWSVKEVVGHVIDAERVFAYRVLCFARGDRQSLPGMDQDEYMRYANFDAQPLGDLADQLAQVRHTTLALFRSFDAAAWLRRGLANNSEASVRALAYVIAGHELHHVRVLRTKYL